MKRQRKQRMRLALSPVCDQCGRARGSGDHTKCSRQRQADHEQKAMTAPRTTPPTMTRNAWT